MQQYLNAHAALEARRAAAKAAGGEGPRVCVVGPTDSGKSTLCKILLNYGVRWGWWGGGWDGGWWVGGGGLGGQQDSRPSPARAHAPLQRHGWAPMFVDLDIGQGSITVPGGIAATPVEAPIDVEEGLAADAPLVYYFGHSSPSENPALYKHLVERLAAVLALRGKADPAPRAAGVVVNTMGWVEELGYELLRHALVREGTQPRLVTPRR